MTRRFLKFSLWAVAGLLAAQMGLRADTPAAPLARSAVLDGKVAYLQVGQVVKNLADAIRAAQGALAVSNKIAGTVLDLRFADGDDPDSAKAAADLLASQKSFLAVLMNAETRDAALQLVADLRAARAGLVFESVTGPAQSNATASVQADIVVPIGSEDVRAFMINPFSGPAQMDTNAPLATNSLLPPVDHTSEADLIRAKIKDGDEFEPVSPEAPAEAPKPLIRDPLLARAVDLIKGLAIVRHPS